MKSKSVQRREAVQHEYGCFSKEAFARKDERIKELEADIKDREDSYAQIVADDRSKDEQHCGCCVELRDGVKRLQQKLHDITGERDCLYLDNEKYREKVFRLGDAAVEMNKRIAELEIKLAWEQSQVEVMSRLIAELKDKELCHACNDHVDTDGEHAVILGHKYCAKCIQRLREVNNGIL